MHYMNLFRSTQNHTLGTVLCTQHISCSIDDIVDCGKFRNVFHAAIFQIEPASDMKISFRLETVIVLQILIESYHPFQMAKVSQT